MTLVPFSGPIERHNTDGRRSQRRQLIFFRPPKTTQGKRPIWEYEGTAAGSREEEFEMVRLTHHPAIYELAPKDNGSGALQVRSHAPDYAGSAG